MVAQAVDAHGHGTVQYSTAPLHVTVMGWVTVPNRSPPPGSAPPRPGARGPHPQKPNGQRVALERNVFLPSVFAQLSRAAF